ncbi:MAG TPA: hypothetical protein VL728_08465 [Cyclobacteriaceae bacterium]|jgi:hypothetical protein|nr:hypothetical protein [Cyclobacteriaceae bacterium]
MKYIIALLLSIVGLSSCSTKDNYDVARYYNLQEQDSLRISIVTHIFEAPPHTPTKDRFLNEHRAFYLKASAQFSFLKYFIAEDGTHYFYVMRPAWRPNDKRGVCGYFKMGKNFKLVGFHEVFVTPMLPEVDVKGRCSFLFEELVKGNRIDKYLSMPTYVQWPNKISYYDTITYEWKLIPGAMQ